MSGGRRYRYQITVTVSVGGLEVDYNQSKLLFLWSTSTGLESSFAQFIYWTRASGHYRGVLNYSSFYGSRELYNTHDAVLPVYDRCK